MSFPVEHSAFVLGWSLSQLQLRFRGLLKCPALAGKRFLESDYEMNDIMRFRDELEHALENLKEHMLGETFGQNRASRAVETCKALRESIYDVLDPESPFLKLAWKELFDDSPESDASEDWESLCSSLPDDLLGSTETFATTECGEKIRQDTLQLFCKLESRVTALLEQIPQELKPFHKLGALLTESITTADTSSKKERYLYVQEKVCPAFRAGLKECAKHRPDMARLLIESLNYERLRDDVCSLQESIRELLGTVPVKPGNPNDPDSSGTTRGKALPKNPEEWERSIRDGVELCGQKFDQEHLPSLQLRVLKRLTLARSRLSAAELAQVHQTWKSAMESTDESEQNRTRRNISSTVGKLRKYLSERFGIDRKRKDVIPHEDDHRGHALWKLETALLEERSKQAAG